MQEGWRSDLASALARAVRAKNEVAARKAASAFQVPAGAQDVLREAKTLHPDLLANMTASKHTRVQELMEEIASTLFLGEDGDSTSRSRKHDDERAVLRMAIPHIRALRSARTGQPLSDEHREHVRQLNEIVRGW